jgi:hypothetical protein
MIVGIPHGGEKADVIPETKLGSSRSLSAFLLIAECVE